MILHLRVCVQGGSGEPVRRERGCRRNGEGKAGTKIWKQETHDGFQESDVVIVAGV